MPKGKKAGQRCVQLDERNRCLIFGKPERPSVCSSLRPDLEMCGSDNHYAFAWLTQLEHLTSP